MNEFDNPFAQPTTVEVVKEASAYQREAPSYFINSEQKRRRNSRTTFHLSKKTHMRLKLAAMRATQEEFYPTSNGFGVVTMNDVLEAAVESYLDFLESEVFSS